MELSLHFDKDSGHHSNRVLAKFKFEETISHVMRKMTLSVLDSESVRTHMLRQINTIQLIECLGQLPTNILAIGWN